jgi:2-keto-4-pentenoate hydratase/2-oxohepta-3-ene-1,7-dioic acid hydratase in catechol pathway
MKIGTYLYQGNPFAAIVEGESIYPVQSILAHFPQETTKLKDVLSIIQAGESGLSVLTEAFHANKSSIKPYSFAEVQFAAPIPRPSKNIFCVGRNYIEHVEEGDRANGNKIGAPSKPIFFTKTPTSVIGHEQPIIYHECTKKLDYEIELAVIIGKTGINIAKDEVNDYIFGYTILNDVTARDLQDEHSQWFKGKTLDTFCPTGPFIVTKEELSWPLNISMQLMVNGEVRQTMNTQDMIFDVPSIIAELSKGMTLEAGDIIATGTGPGCGFGFQPPKFLSVGDTVELHIEGIGILRNQVI